MNGSRRELTNSIKTGDKLQRRIGERKHINTGNSANENKDEQKYSENVIIKKHKNIRIIKIINN
jgi:hypothetical protein